MSDDVDLVRSLFAAWERGDWSSTDWADPEIEFVIAEGPDARSLTGLRAMVGAWREFLNAWTEYGVRADDIRELGDGRVLVILHAVGSGKTSGVQLGEA